MSEAHQLARIEALLDVRREDRAVVLLRQLLAADPHDAGVLRMLAYALVRLGEHGAALDAAHQALALDPEDEWGHRLASTALAALGRWVPAVTAAQESVRLAPGNWRGHAHLARALVDRAVHSPAAFNGPVLRGARQAAERAVELAPEEPDAHYAQALVAQRRGRVGEARAGYRRALQLDPEHVGALTALGELQPRLSGAANLFGSALRVDPRSAHAVGHLRDVGFRLLLGYGLLGFLLLVVEVVAGLTVAAPSVAPPGWVRPVLLVGGLAAVALPVLAVGRGLERSLRPFLLRLPRTDRRVGIWVSTLAGAWLALLVLPVLPTAGRVLAVQAAAALGVPGFVVPAFVVGVPMALRRVVARS